MTDLLRRFSFVLTTLTLGLALGTSCFAAPDSRVFTMTNSATGNSVLVYTRAADGSLTLSQTVPTGGNGAGVFLMSQNAIISASHYLFVVNAGSNTISVMTIGNTKLSLVSTISSGGSFPLSLTFFESHLYVVNQNNLGNITGFTFNGTSGILTPIPGSTQPLSGMPNPSPAEIAFNKSGTALIVTEKNTNLIDVYPVTNFVAGKPTSYSSHSPTPYGFATGLKTRFYVTEANGSVPFGSAVSSYNLPANSVPSTISASVGTTQSAACWIVLSAPNTFAYVTDNESNALSVYSIDANGALTLLTNDTVSTSTLGGPFDDGLSTDGAFLYVLFPGKGMIGVYAVNADGSLTFKSAAAGVASVSSGLLVR